MYHRGTRQTPACTHVANYVLIKKRSTVMAAPVYTDTPPPQTAHREISPRSLARLHLRSRGFRTLKEEPTLAPPRALVVRLCARECIV